MSFHRQLRNILDVTSEALDARLGYFERQERERWVALLKRNDPTNPFRFYLILLRASFPLALLLFLAPIPLALADEPAPMRELVSAFAAMHATTFLVCAAVPLLVTLLLLRGIMRPSTSLAAAINTMGMHVGGATALGFLYGLAAAAVSITTSMADGSAPRLDVMTTAVTASVLGAFLGILWTLIIQIADVTLHAPSPITAPFLAGLVTWAGTNVISNLGLTPTAVLNALVRSKSSALRSTLSHGLPRPLTNAEWAEVATAWSHAVPEIWVTGLTTVAVVMATLRRVIELERPRWKSDCGPEVFALDPAGSANSSTANDTSPISHP